jgi:hypothetical protein
MLQLYLKLSGYGAFSLSIPELEFLMIGSRLTHLQCTIGCYETQTEPYSSEVIYSPVDN